MFLKLASVSSSNEWIRRWKITLIQNDVNLLDKGIMYAEIIDTTVFDDAFNFRKKVLEKKDCIKNKLKIKSSTKKLIQYVYILVF